jgi:integrase
MDLQKLKNEYPLLISYMKAQNYNRCYVRSVKMEIKWILKESAHYHWKTFDDIYQTYVETWMNKNTLSGRLLRLRVIKRFVLESAMPDGLKHTPRSSNYNSLCDEFKHFIDIYRDAVKMKDEKSCRYNKVIEYSASSFLLRLQKQGVSSLEHTTEKNVLDVFNNDSKLTHSYKYKQTVSTAFNVCAPFYPENTCAKIITWLPAIQNIRKNVQYLTKEEIKRFKYVLEKDSSLSLQNKAIAMLAFYTGLRSSDIATLTFDQIDWENDLIRIIQQKTGIPHVLPLRAIVGNAIFDYITEERPKSSEDTVFLTVNVPHRRLHTANLYSICVGIMKKTGIRNNSGDRIRHHFATSLLENEVDYSVISRTLGHQSPKTLHQYMEADFIHLKECSLSIECFPITEGIFQ